MSAPFPRRTAPGAAATLLEAFRLGARIFGDLLPRLLRAG
jgi:hypothetical protein